MDLRETLYAVAGSIGGFAAGVVTNILKTVMPTYVDLSRENGELRERIRELESLLDDEEAMRAKGVENVR